MTIKEELIQFVYDRLSSVYCNDCRGQIGKQAYNNTEDDESYDRCEECHRKAMNWGISVNEATRIVNHIEQKLAEEWGSHG